MHRNCISFLDLLLFSLVIRRRGGCRGSAHGGKGDLGDGKNTPDTPRSPPRVMRIAVFSATVIAAERNAGETRAILALLDRAIHRAVVSAAPSSL
jgi:hypothetical protein